MGEPVPDISWYFNGVMINVSDNSSKYMIMSRSLNITTTEINGNVITSLIMITKLSNVGSYPCYGENIFGDDQNFVVLVVNSKQYLMISYLIFN